MNSQVSKKKIIDIGGLPVITCSSCGAKILLVLNVKAMGEAIEVHVEEHIQKVRDPSEGVEELERIYLDLISQVFDKVSKA